MKKIMILAASAALVLAGCAKMQTIETNDVDSPVGFAPYVGNAVTKAGSTGELTDAKLASEGFGVFAFVTTGDYAGGIYPNFMYNEKVYKSGETWTYDHIKYWPNQIQNGNTDGQTPPATAKQADKVSFFAYAPYVAAGSGTSGIKSISAKNFAGDPTVTYTMVNTLDDQVDLCWGVVNPSENVTWNTVVSGVTIPLSKGLPFLNLQKPAINTPIHFYFRHALAQLNLQAVAAYNQLAAGGTAQNEVKITIEKVKLTVPGINSTATLNLNNDISNEPKWVIDAATADYEMVVEGDNIHADVKDDGEGAQTATVTNTPKDVIVANKYFTIIPKSTETSITVEVTYYVTTEDTALQDGYSRVKNVITHDVKFAKLQAGTKNTIKMILGISEVKFEAETTAWGPGVESEVDLPKNK
jgi:hypothetical protein